MSTLFDPLKLGALQLPNRILMAPLTRSRATPDARVPTHLQRDYYVQRTSAGLIISEATSVSPMGVGYAATHHAGLAIQAGIPKAAVDEILQGKVPGSLAANEAVVVRYVLEFASAESITDATFAEMRKHYDERQITDVTLIAAYYLAYGTMIKGLRVQLESKDKLDIEMRWQKEKAAP